MTQKRYSDLYIGNDNRTMDEICNVNAFSYQKQQTFVKRWFDNKNKKLLLFHGLGSGKTCSSILAIEAMTNQGINHVYVVTPASLKDNYKKELRGECGKYGSINKNITVISHIGFAKLQPKLRNCLVIIDEVQNIISSTGTTYKEYFNMLVTKTTSALRVVLLSATPMFDQPHEIALTLNLLDLPQAIPVLKFYTEYFKKDKTIKNEDDFIKRVSGYVSAFKGISPRAYAKRIDVTYLCNMSQHQYGSYTKSVQGMTMNNVAFSQAFLSGPRVASNIVYQNGGFGTSYRPKDYLLKKELTTNLKRLSTKFFRCINVLKKIDGPAFVYSNFVAAGGINDFALVLSVNGYTETNPLKSKPRSVGKRFGVFRTGKDKENSALVSLFNSPENQNGEILKVILGSPAMKEGISLKNTRSVHLLDPYWNRSRTEQIIGRAIRFCSHVSLPTSKRNVQVFHYITNIQSQKRKTVDQHIMHMSNEKAQLVQEFESLLYKAAVDCSLFHRVNGLQLTDCKYMDRFMLNSKIILEQVTEFPIDSNGISIDPKKEERLKELLSMQVVKLTNKKQQIGFNIMVKAAKNVEFAFIDPLLSNFIQTHSWQNSNKNVATVQMFIKPTNKMASVKNNYKADLHHLQFNKGVQIKKKYTVIGGSGRNKIKSEHIGCIKARRPDSQGNCSKIFPFKRKNEKTDRECCYKKPTYTKGMVKTNDGKVYIDGQIANTLTFDQLTKAAKSFGKALRPQMRRKNLINVLKA